MVVKNQRRRYTITCSV